jgi:hypothetical protein
MSRHSPARESDDDMHDHRSDNSWLITLGLCTLFALGCDPDYDEDELAQDLQAEADEEEAAKPAHPKTVDEIVSDVKETLANYWAPVGYHYGASCTGISGWAKDGDTTAPTTVKIHKDAPYPGGTWVADATANLYEATVPFSDKYHGFSIALPAALKTGQQEFVYVSAVNIDTNGAPVPGAPLPLLEQSGTQMCCRPTGFPCALIQPL